jgi:hypothetical protein
MAKAKRKSKLLQTVKEDLQSNLPAELVRALLDSYEEMKKNYIIEKHEPSELNGGKFVEACIRILQQETTGSYTAVGKHIRDIIGKLRQFEQLPANNHNESFRIHIPRTLTAIYSIRYKRGVGHLGGDVNPNRADATLLIACADWVMAELFRIYYQCSLAEAQRIVDALVQRSLPLVHKIGDKRRVLLTSLSFKDQTLLVLASEHPNEVEVSNLLSWLEPKTKTYYLKDVLKPLHGKRLIESDGSVCEILPTGLSYVETHYTKWMAKLREV